MFGLPSREKRRAVGSVLARALILAFASAWRPITASALELAWTAPTSCPSQVEVQQRIDSLLGPSSARTTARATALITATRAGYQLKLTLSGGVEGSRRLSGKDCNALAESAAFLIAVAIDPSLPGTQPVPDPPPPPAPPAEEQPPAAPAPTPTPPLPAPLPAPTRSAWFHAAGFGGLWRALDPVQVQLGGALGAGL
ncbi:MAG TPA: hypothetical protein VEX18_16960, partial [Polyangiaceae bacterium]|nr:hypothetical protein [Polyangiaceae bacterium]